MKKKQRELSENSADAIKAEAGDKKGIIKSLFHWIVNDRYSPINRAVVNERDYMGTKEKGTNAVKD